MRLFHSLIKKSLALLILVLWSMSTQAAISPQPPETSAKSYVLMDARTSEVLAEKDMNERMPPASLTKLMTAYVASAALRNGDIQLNDMVTISKKAWKMEGSRMFIQVGSKVSVEDLLHGIVVASGNDACVALAEHVAGTEDAFVQLMDQDAARLGMENTNFTDSTGMPDPNHYSSAYDMALLIRAIIQDYPEDYEWYKRKWIKYNNIRQPNRNRLLWRDPSVDGLKTGHTSEAGYCLASSAKRDDMRLIAVVMGAPSDGARTRDSQALLNWGFRFFDTHKLYNANELLDQKYQPRVWFAKEKYAKLGFPKDVFVTVPANQFKKIDLKVLVNSDLSAPVVKGESYGKVEVTLDDESLLTIPVVALEDDPKGNIFSRLWDHIAILFARWFHHND